MWKEIKLLYAEIIFETGNKSVAQYDSMEEMKSALAEHHRRALNGEPGTGHSTLRNDLEPGESRIGSWVAERVKKVLLYDEHPASHGEDQLVPIEDVEGAVTSAIDESGMNGVVHVHTVAAAIRDLSNPLIVEPKVHESQYKMKEKDELDLSFLKAVEDNA
jgi:hypothetical protein